MAKYFLGSVGTAEAFRMVNGELRLAFVSKTLTDSAVNISTTKDDIRGGTGAPIQFSFYHDPNVEINLTDIVFDEAYVEAQLGTEFKFGGNAYKSASYDAEAGRLTYTIPDTLAELNMGCGNSKKVVWYSLDNGDWKIATTELEGQVFTAPKAGKVCLRYVAWDENAKIAEISSDMIPEELFLVITAPIFAGDACSASNGKKAGEITYEVPRFKLNGAQEFTMNMSSNQTMSLAGIALASVDGCEVNGSKLLRIITVYNDLNWYDDVDEILLGDKNDDGELEVWAKHKNGTVQGPLTEGTDYTKTSEGDNWVYTFVYNTDITVSVPKGE